MTVDGRGNVYVNSLNFDFADFVDVMSSGEAPGKIALVSPDGEAREVADGLAFPNGMVVTPDNATLIVVGAVVVFLRRNRGPVEEETYHFVCPSCKRRLRYRARQVGNKGKCPQCGNELTFPPLSKAIP